MNKNKILERKEIHVKFLPVTKDCGHEYLKSVLVRARSLWYLDSTGCI